jgi:hypothetical protein
MIMSTSLALNAFIGYFQGIDIRTLYNQLWLSTPFAGLK